MIHEFTNLPPLTTDEANVVAAMLTAEGSLDDVASVTNNDLGTFLDLLASPNVQTHLAHARRMMHQRTDHRLAEAAHTAVETLETIAQDTQHDRTERRRAATTLLRAFGCHVRVAMRSRGTHSPTSHSRDLSPSIDLDSLVKLAESLSQPSPGTPVEHPAKAEHPTEPEHPADATSRIDHRPSGPPTVAPHDTRRTTRELNPWHSAHSPPPRDAPAPSRNGHHTRANRPTERAPPP